MRSPSRVRNQPLKSAHQTALARVAAANGWVYGGVRLRQRRACTRPARPSSAPMVLAAGHSRSG